MAKFGRADIRKIIGEACTEEIENQLIALHMGVIDPLKDALDSAKAESAKVAELQKKLDEATADKGKFEDMKAKYEKEHSEFEAFKTRTESEKALETVKTLYRALLKETKVDEKRIDSILKVTDLSQIKVGKDGKLEDAENLTKNIKDEWKEFIVTKGTKGADVDTPPENGGKSMTREEIMKIKDTTERQKAIAENLSVFGR